MRESGSRLRVNWGAGQRWQPAPLPGRLAVLAVWLLSACGDGTTDPSPPDEANRSPAASGTIPAQTVHIGDTVTVSLSGYFSDPDGDALTYSAQSSNGSVATVSVSGSNAVVSGVTQGDAAIMVTATDPDGLSAQQSFPVTVPNRAPQIAGNISDLELFTGNTVEIDISAFFSDPDGDALTYSAQTSDAGVATVSVSGTNLVVSAVAKGSATIAATATDPGGLSAQQSFSVTVPNRAPQIAGNISDLELFTGNTVEIAVSAFFSDPDGDTLIYSARTSDAGVATVSVSGTNLVVSAAAKGSATITATATDPDGLSAQQSFSVTVPNRAPQIAGNISDLELFTGNTIEIDFSAFFSDPDGDTLTYSARTSDAGVATVSVSGTNLVLSAAAKGSATITATATDPDGLSAQQSFSVTVPNQAPRIAGNISDLQLFVEDAVEIDLSAFFNDPDGDALTYEAAISNAGVATTTVDGETVTVIAVSEGSASLTVTASDPEGLSAQQEVPTTVAPHDDPRIQFVSVSATAPEGGRIVVRVAASPAPESALDIGYTISRDNDPWTDDANEADHNGGSGGKVRFPAQARRATFEISVQDDKDIEPTRETFTVSLDTPDESAGYVLGPFTTMIVTIEEGVCDRTPRVRDALVALTGVDQCHETDGSHLRAINWLNLQGPPPEGRAAGFHSSPSAATVDGRCGATTNSRGAPAFSTRDPRMCVSRTYERPPLPLAMSSLGTGSDEPITELLAGDFQELTELEHLWLFDNKLTELPAGIFSDLEELREVHLQSNLIRELPARLLSGLSQLEVFHITDNELTRLPPDLFAGLRWLREVWISENQLVELPAGLVSDADRLEELQIWGNRLSELPKDIFSGLVDLRELSLGSNLLAELDVGLFKSLRSLERLFLAENRLSELRPGTFSGLDRLEWLTLSGLRVANLEPGVFAGLANLTNLWLDGGEITQVHTGAFDGLSRLTELTLHENQLSVLADDAFTGLPRLEELWIYRNRIRELPEEVFAGMPLLDKLVMWDNRLTGLPPNVFANLENLQELYLAGNAIAQLHAGVFSSLAGLDTLIVRNNNLAELPDGLFEGLLDLNRFSAAANPGAPFSLDVRLERRDTTDLAAPGPAKVVLSLAEGAPFSMRIPLSVDGGSLSADTAVIEQGHTTSAEFTVTMTSGSQAGTQLVAGPAPPIPDKILGVEVVAADTLVLFVTSGDASGTEPGMAARTDGHGPKRSGAAPAMSIAGLLRSAGPRLRRRSKGKDARPRTGCSAGAGHRRPAARERSAGGRAWSTRASERAP